MLGKTKHEYWESQIENEAYRNYAAMKRKMREAEEENIRKRQIVRLLIN